MIDTFSIFYFDHEISSENQNLPFDEGSGEVNATIQIGSYTLTEFATATETALNAASVTRTFTVTVNRATQKITIAADGTFDLLIGTGSTIGSSAFTLLGFTGSTDLTGLATYTGDSISGDFYKPQFKFQNFVDKNDFQDFVDPSVNESTDGNIEIIRYGTRQFYEFDIKYITNTPMDDQVIKSNATGLEDARRFFRSITKRTPFEIMLDIDDRDTFDKVILERIPGSRTATGYRLQELFRRQVRDVYEVNGIRLRVG